MLASRLYPSCAYNPCAPWVAVLTRSSNRLLGLSADEIMIYHQIESSGINGIWIKTIKQRTSIVQTVITKSMKVLESKRLVKPVKSIKNPAQKIYMLAYLSPSEGVTGGPWFQDGELDMEMIGVTADAVVIFIEQQSWAKGYIKRERSISPIPQLDEASGAPPAQKRKRGLGDGDIEGVHSKAKRRNAHHTGEETQISYPPGYRNYPTVAAIFHFVKEAGFIKADVPLMESDIQGLLDVLVFDDRIEKIGNGYRTIRGVFGSTEAMKNMMHGRAPGEAIEDADGNGLTQAPCGRCPVFNLCEEGGPVNARNCVYFDAWLRT